MAVGSFVIYIITISSRPLRKVNTSRPSLWTMKNFGCSLYQQVSPYTKESCWATLFFCRWRDLSLRRLASKARDLLRVNEHKQLSVVCAKRSQPSNEPQKGIIPDTRRICDLTGGKTQDVAGSNPDLSIRVSHSIGCASSPRSTRTRWTSLCQNSYQLFCLCSHSDQIRNSRLIQPYRPTVFFYR